MVVLRVLVKAAYSIYSGYGKDSLGLTKALMAAGCDVYLDPVVMTPPLPQEIADLMTKPLQAPFDLLIHHVDPGAMGLEQHTWRAAKTRVAWTMWERSSLDNLNNKNTLRKRFNGAYDLLLAYDQTTQAAFEPWMKRSRSFTELPPVGLLQGGYDPSEWSFVERDWAKDRFIFCMVGQLHERKDPWVAIEAFRELKEQFPEEFEPAELMLKTNVMGLHPGIEDLVPKLKIFYDVWPPEQLKAFYEQTNCLLAPSRGEGKNLPALEMMSTGGAVIATNWGGHTGWMNSEYAYPLNYTLVPPDPKFPDCMEARASKEHLKELMLRVFRDRSETRRKGEIASNVIPQMMSWNKVVDDLFRRLRDLIPEKGRPLYDQYARLQSTRD